MNMKEIDYATLLSKSIVATRFVTNWFDKMKCLDFLAPLLLRLYLVPVFWVAGSKKFANFGDTVDWFGNTDGGLGLPWPLLLVFLTACIEIIGALFLLLGVGVRIISVPLMIAMVVAAITAHWKYGWLAIATGDGLLATDRTRGAIERLQLAQSILQQHGDYQWLTENGSFMVLNNGIEFAATYFLMLLALFFMGGGRYVSADYWLRRFLIDSKA
jgi:putative oxidoreductase